MINEIWKDSPYFPEKYEISNMGNLRNKERNHIYKNTNKNGDYFSIVLTYKGMKKSTRIHRLVAETFIPNPNKYPCVNHKDFNKQNNKVDNLEWCTYSDNTKHAIKNNKECLRGIKRYNRNKSFNKYGYIYQYDKNNNFIGKYRDTQEAYKKTGVCSRNILQCINKQQGRTQAGGYVWKSQKEVVKNVES